MLHRLALCNPGVHFILSRSTSALSHRKLAPAGMSPDGYRADDNDKTRSEFTDFRKEGEKI